MALTQRTTHRKISGGVQTPGAVKRSSPSNRANVATAHPEIGSLPAGAPRSEARTQVSWCGAESFQRMTLSAAETHDYPECASRSAGDWVAGDGRRRSDPDLQVVFSCSDPDVMSARIKYWGLEQSQLGQGPFQGAIRGTHSARIQLGCSFRSPGLLIQGVIPAETVVLSSIVRQTSPIILNGSKVAADQMMWAKAGHELDFRTLGENELVTAAVHAPLFHKMALAVLGAGFFDRKPADRLALRGPQSRHDVGVRLRNLVEQDLAQPGRLSDHEYASAWEHQVLDTWLAQVIAPDPGASLPVRCRAARQAESFLREHRDRPVSVCELCMVTGVPKRTLMLGFRDLFSLSPAAYHRRHASERGPARSRPRQARRDDGDFDRTPLGLRPLRAVLGGLPSHVWRVAHRDVTGIGSIPMALPWAIALIQMSGLRPRLRIKTTRSMTSSISWLALVFPPG